MRHHVWTNSYLSRRLPGDQLQKAVCIMTTVGTVSGELELELRMVLVCRRGGSRLVGDGSPVGSSVSGTKGVSIDQVDAAGTDCATTLSTGARLARDAMCQAYAPNNAAGHCTTSGHSR
jgi:hypothetical protein